jgi:hypothetical protein
MNTIYQIRMLGNREDSIVQSLKDLSEQGAKIINVIHLGSHAEPLYFAIIERPEPVKTAAP